MNKIASIIVTFALLAGAGIVFLSGSENNFDPTRAESAQHNVEIRDGVQYVTINVKGGYSPRVSTAQAGIPTKVVMKTNGTYDCSASLVIRAIDYQNILPHTGEEVIDLGTPKAGQPLQGICSMGMYNFRIDFK